MQEAKKMKPLSKMKVPENEVDRQWEMFAEEYNIPDNAELNQSENDPTSMGLRSLKAAWKRMIRAGMVEVIEDASEGIIVKQFLAHAVEGINTDPPCLIWKAPTIPMIATARMGTKGSEEIPSIQQWMKYAAAATQVSESILGVQLKGGDQSRMAAIAQLFILA